MPKTIWWDGSDLAPFFAAVMKRGCDNVRIELRDDLLYVIPMRRVGDDRLAKSAEDGPFNFVHTCPPDCPE